MKKLLSIILTITLLLTLAPLNTQAAKPKITYKKLTMITGDTFSGLYLKNGYVKSMKSSNKKVVSVDEYGDLKAKKAGTATITLKDYNKKSYKCKVTVYDKNFI